MKTFSSAKINLTLEILGKRPDGFHELATWMLPIGLYDSIEIELANQPSFALERAGAERGFARIW